MKTLQPECSAERPYCHIKTMALKQKIGDRDQLLPVLGNRRTYVESVPVYYHNIIMAMGARYTIIVQLYGTHSSYEY